MESEVQENYKMMQRYTLIKLCKAYGIPSTGGQEELADRLYAYDEQVASFQLEISDEDFIHLAKAAHERDITLNQLCVDVLKSSFNDLDYRFEHQSKPQVLKEY